MKFIRTTEVNRAVDLYNNTDMCLTDIAKELGRSVTGLRYHLVNRGCDMDSKAHYPESVKQKVRELRSQNISFNEIAEAVGYTEDKLRLLYKAMRKTGESITINHLNDTDKEYIRAHNKHMTERQIADVLHRDFTTIVRFIKKEGLMTRKDKVKAILLRYPTADLNKLSVEYGMPVVSIRALACRNNIHRADVKMENYNPVKQSEVVMMCKLFEQGYTISRIAVVVHRGSNTVKQYLQKNGYETHHRFGRPDLMSKENTDKLLKLVAEGNPATIIAIMLKTDKKAIYNRMLQLRKQGMTTLRIREDSLTAEDKQYILDNYPHQSMVSIANHLGRTPRLVSRTIEELGIGYNSDLAQTIRSEYSYMTGKELCSKYDVPLHFVLMATRKLR